jgi:protein-S-isoprenylcysteine O-methyltransferase Ste14
VAAAVTIIAAVWFVGFPWLLVSSGVDPFPLRLGPLRALGLVPLAAGAVVFARVTREFAVGGGGTPLVFDAPTELVTTGLNRSVRNPMYLADVAIIAGEGMLLDSSAVLLYAAGLWGALHALVVAIEEPRLRRRFGHAYEEYCRRVPRWIPRRPIAPR